MVVSASEQSGGTHAPNISSGMPAEVVWHELECGCYRADLPLWRKLVAAAAGPILDIGAGSGRVALDLARSGHDLTALDLSPVLLEGLRRRVVQERVETVCADARSFTLSRQDYGLCIVPMQTVQLLGGSSGRLAFLRCAAAHLRPGGLLACAIVSELEPFDCADGDAGPAPETVHADGLLYISRATRVAQRRGSVVIERERRIVPERERGAAMSATGAAVERPVERDLIKLDRVSSSELEREAREQGLIPERALQIAATEEHVGSIVVMLRA
jgi:SAM-dependent methyltransferase